MARLGLDPVAATVEEEIGFTLVIQQTFSLSRPLAKFVHMVTLQTLAERRSEILGLAARYRTGDVRVFGSVARGEATENSDVDILINARQGCSLFECPKTHSWIHSNRAPRCDRYHCDLGRDALAVAGQGQIQGSIHRLSQPPQAAPTRLAAICG